MTPLHQIIHNEISQNGAMRFDRFWNIAMTHPTHGYYVNAPAIGAAGDFITAPEISQMFGEMIGVWAAQQWLRLGAPIHINIVECGAGRGTLMADLLRATKNIDGFHDALNVHIIDINAVLIAQQKHILSGYDNVHWHDDITDMNADAPCLIIGNEFLDALPVRQFKYTGEGWQERYVDVDVDVDDDDALAATFLPDTKHITHRLNDHSIRAKIGDTIEVSPARETFMSRVYNILNIAGGAGLFIDYGHAQTAFGDTVQAVKNHQYSDVLSDIGAADITSHVDFQPLMEGAKTVGLAPSPLRAQNVFLYALGIDKRAKTLLSGANDEQAARIKAGLRRLTAPDQMGDLFKVMEIVKT